MCFERSSITETNVSENGDTHDPFGVYGIRLCMPYG